MGDIFADLEDPTEWERAGANPPALIRPKRSRAKPPSEAQKDYLSALLGQDWNPVTFVRFANAGFEGPYMSLHYAFAIELVLNGNNAFGSYEQIGDFLENGVPLPPFRKVRTFKRTGGKTASEKELLRMKLEGRRDMTAAEYNARYSGDAEVKTDTGRTVKVTERQARIIEAQREAAKARRSRGR